MAALGKAIPEEKCLLKPGFLKGYTTVLMILATAGAGHLRGCGVAVHGDFGCPVFCARIVLTTNDNVERTGVSALYIERPVP